MSSDMFDLVRSHLMETNALGEAEELLLKRMLDNPTPKAANRIPAMAPSTLSSSGSKGVIDALKVSDLLGAIEDGLAAKPQIAYVPPPKPAPVVDNLPIEELEKLAEEEIWMLEQKKLAVKRQMENKRAEVERAKILDELSKPSAEQQRSLRSLKDEVFSASHQLQQKLRNVSDQHQKVISQQRSHTLNAQRELQSLQRGDWSAGSSMLLAEKLGRPAPSAATDSTSMSEELLRKSRVQQLLSKFQDTEEVSQRRQRISDLRNKDKQLLQVEERAQQLVRSTPRTPAAEEGSASHVPHDGPSERALPAEDFLDRWLQDEIRPAAPTQGKPSIPTVEKTGLSPDVQAELQRLQRENQQLKASLGLLAEGGGDDVPRGHPSSAAKPRRERREGEGEGEGERAGASSVPMAGPPFSTAQQAPHLSHLAQPPPWGGYGQPPLLHQPGPPPGYYPPAQAAAQAPVVLDTVQQAMLAQMQRIAEQLEKENSGLTALGMGMGLPASSSSSSSSSQPVPNPLVRQLHGPASPQAAPPLASPSSLSWGAGPGEAGSRLERQKQEEIRLLRYELERLKQQKELDDFKQTVASQRLAARKADEHQQWLEEQKRDLQALKMRQLLAKEQRLLQYQAQPMASPGQGDDGAGRLASLREECGVGGGLVPLSLAKGVTVLVDGLWGRGPRAASSLSSSQSSASLPDAAFRLVAGVYDRSGQPLLAKLSATAWQAWRGMDRPAGEGAAGRGPGWVQPLDDLLVLTLRPADLPAAPEGPPSPALLGAKCLFELQVRSEAGAGAGAGAKAVGWAVFPLFGLASSSSLATADGEGPGVVLQNGAWKVDLQPGLSDPTADAHRVSPPPPLSAPGDGHGPGHGHAVLFRLLDSAENYRGSAWRLSAALDGRQDGEVLRLYRGVDGLARGASDARLLPAPSALRLGQPAATAAGGSLSHAVSRRAVRSPSSAPDTPSQAARGASALSARVADRLPDRLASLGSMLSLGGGGSHSNPLHRVVQVGDDGHGDDDARRAVASPHAVPSAKGAATGSLASLGLGPGAVASGPDRQNWWLLGPTLGPCTERYQRGDGVDIYVDRCLFLPDNTTVTRVSLRLYSATKDQLGPVHQGLSLADSPAISPVFRMKAECRGNAFPPTTTILLRFDTLDASTLVPVSTGYACLKMFATRDRQQPKPPGSGPGPTPLDQGVYINTGAFQLPVYGGRIPHQLKAFDDDMLSSLPRIPCASVLVRILCAPKSADGISTLSREEFPPEDWPRLGLDIPAPAYGTGAYYGALCEPTAAELQAFEAKASLYLSLGVETAVLQALQARKDHDLPHRPSDPQPAAMQAWLQSLLPPLDKMRRLLDYTLAVPYSVEAGLAVKIVQLFNLPEASLFSEHSRHSLVVHKVIASTSPPALFYKDPPLVDGVQYTRTHQWESYQRAPCFQDDYMDFLPAEMSFGLYLVLDIRCVVVEARKGKKKTGEDGGARPVKITVEPPGQRKSFWTLLPLARERCPGQGFRHCQSGFFQLPLIEGPVPEGEIFRAMNPFKEVLQRLAMKKQAKAISNAAGETSVATPLKLAADSASVLVKVYNPLLRDLVWPDLEAGASSAGGSVETTPDVMYLAPMLEAAAQGQTGGAVARMERFAYSASKYSADNRHAGKTLAQLRPVGLAEDYDLNKAVNEAFAAATGITALV